MVMRSALAAATLAAVALSPLAAQAHAFLKRADPKVGSTVAKPPAAIRLTFTEAVEAPFCRVTVSGPPGFGGAAPPRAVPGDPAGVSIALKGPAPPGTYTVRWRALSADTHVTEGDFSFKVQPLVRP